MLTVGANLLYKTRSRTRIPLPASRVSRRESRVEGSDGNARRVPRVTSGGCASWGRGCIRTYVCSILVDFNHHRHTHTISLLNSHSLTLTLSFLVAESARRKRISLTHARRKKKKNEKKSVMVYENTHTHTHCHRFFQVFFTSVRSIFCRKNQINDDEHEKHKNKFWCFPSSNSIVPSILLVWCGFVGTNKSLSIV